MASKKMSKKTVLRISRKGEKTISVRVARGNKEATRKAYAF